MSYAEPVARAIDYAYCQYGTSRLSFRGPPQRLAGEYIACLGGTETFGRFVEDPFPDILQEILGVRCVNFGQNNAGPDVFLRDQMVMEACEAAAISVIQITGAQNMTNRFYKVHPRRNDRFVDATDQMRKIFQTVDFTEFHFTRHMLTTLELESPERFRIVRDEIRRTWVTKMNQISARLRKPILLFWLGDRSPDDAGDWIADGDPLFITREMLQSLRGRIADIIELPPMPAAELGGKLYAPNEEAKAMQAPGPEVHEALAEALAVSLRKANVVDLI